MKPLNKGFQIQYRQNGFYRFNLQEMGWCEFPRQAKEHVARKVKPMGIVIIRGTIAKKTVQLLGMRSEYLRADKSAIIMDRCLPN